MTCRIYTVDKTIPDFVSSSLSGHRDYIINAWFSEDMKNVRFSLISSHYRRPKANVFFLASDLFNQ